MGEFADRLTYGTWTLSRSGPTWMWIVGVYCIGVMSRSSRHSGEVCSWVQRSGFNGGWESRVLVLMPDPGQVPCPPVLCRGGSVARLLNPALAFQGSFAVYFRSLHHFTLPPARHTDMSRVSSQTTLHARDNACHLHPPVRVCDIGLGCISAPSPPSSERSSIINPMHSDVTFSPRAGLRKAMPSATRSQ
jgi:hypothetical protein